jgi:hypothetical protein
MRLRTAAMLGLTALLVAVLPACGSSSHASSTPVTVFNLSADPAQNVPTTNAQHHATLTVAALRSTLDSLLAKHATLVAALTHEVGAGNANPNAAVKALGANTQALTNAIALVYGIDGARAFAQLWEQHTQFFIDYAQADRGNHTGAKRLAQEKLSDYQNDFASFVSTATAGGASLTAVTGLLHGHVHDLTSYIDADIAGHAADARQILDQAVAHMHVIAKAVTDAIAAQHLETVTP